MKRVSDDEFTSTEAEILQAKIAIFHFYIRETEGTSTKIRERQLMEALIK